MSRPAEVALTLAQDVAVGSPRVVLFDFDGVLMHGDAFYLFMRERYARSLWRKCLALLVTPLLLLVLPMSRRWPLRVLVRIALLGLDTQGYHVAANAFATSLVRRPPVLPGWAAQPAPAPGAR